MRNAIAILSLLAGCFILHLLNTAIHGSGLSRSGPPHRDLQLERVPWMTDSGDFARRVFQPIAPIVANLDAAKTAAVLERLQPKKTDSLSALLHATHLFGAQVNLEGDKIPLRKVLDLILDSKQAQQIGNQFGDGRVLARTSQGLRFSLVQPTQLSVDQSNVEAHPGQGLAALAAAGVPLTARIDLADGTSGRVRDVLNDLVANFALEGEIFWEATALAIYLPPNRQWTDKFGRNLTFDELSAELLARPLDGSSCAGTHILLALTAILRADLEAPILSLEGRTSLRSHLRDAAARLGRSQLESGGWALDWSARSRGPVTPRDEIIATGHHLEWLMLLPDDLRPDAASLRRGAERCVQLLQNQTADPEWVRTQYCPAVHAARSAWLLSESGARARFAVGRQGEHLPPAEETRVHGGPVVQFDRRSSEGTPVGHRN